MISKVDILLHLILTRKSIAIGLRVMVIAYLSLTDNNIYFATCLHETNREICMQTFGPIEYWITSKVTSLDFLFANEETYDFNSPIDNWDVSSVKSMLGTFYGCLYFNQPLGSWNTSNVTNMEHMFYRATKFNQSLETWNCAKVTSMFAMFDFAESFHFPFPVANSATKIVDY